MDREITCCLQIAGIFRPPGVWRGRPPETHGSPGECIFSPTRNTWLTVRGGGGGGGVGKENKFRRKEEKSIIFCLKHTMTIIP